MTHILLADIVLSQLHTLISAPSGLAADQGADHLLLHCKWHMNF